MVITIKIKAALSNYRIEYFTQHLETSHNPFCAALNNNLKLKTNCFCNLILCLGFLNVSLPEMSLMHISKIFLLVPFSDVRMVGRANRQKQTGQADILLDRGLGEGVSA